MAVSAPLPASVQSFLRQQNLVTTVPEGQEITYEHTEELDVMVRFMLLGMISYAREEENLRTQKDFLASITAEAKSNNVIMSDMQARKEIANAAWPTDLASSVRLRQLLLDDLNRERYAIPNENPYVDPATGLAGNEPYVKTQAERDAIESSEARAQAILNLFKEAEATAAANGPPTEPWPSDIDTQVVFSRWLAAQGIPTNMVGEEERLLGSTENDWFTADELQQFSFSWGSWPGDSITREENRNGDTYYHRIAGSTITQVRPIADSDMAGDITVNSQTIGRTNGESHLNATPAQMRAAGIDVSLVPPGTPDDQVLTGMVMVDAITGGGLVFTFDTAFKSLLPTGVDSKDYFYDQPRNQFFALNENTMLDQVRDPLVAGALYNAFQSGRPWQGWIENGVEQITPDVRVLDPGTDSRTAWDEYFDANFERVKTANNAWGSLASAQQLQTQETIENMNKWSNWFSNMVQRLDKALSTAAANI